MSRTERIDVIDVASGNVLATNAKLHKPLQDLVNSP